MVSSSNPSLSQSSRGLTPEFSKGKTRKIPWPLRCGTAFGVCPQTRPGDKTASRTNAVRRMFREEFTKKVYQTARDTPAGSSGVVLSKTAGGGPTGHSVSDVAEIEERFLHCAALRPRILPSGRIDARWASSSEEGTIYRAPTLGNCAKLNGAESPSATQSESMRRVT